MMNLILDFHEACNKALGQGADVKKLIVLPVREQIGRYKYTKEDDLDTEYKKVETEINAEVDKVISQKEDF